MRKNYIKEHRDEDRETCPRRQVIVDDKIRTAIPGAGGSAAR